MALTVLVYHPAFDPFHCLYRVSALLANTNHDEAEIDKIRICDFYLVFPGLLAEARLPRAAGAIRKLAKQYSNRFDAVESPRELFLRMEGLHLAVMQAMSAQGIIQSDRYKVGYLRPIIRNFPDSIVDNVARKRSLDKDILAFLVGDFMELSLYGNGGLKARTALMEHRYDSA